MFINDIKLMLRQKSTYIVLILGTVIAFWGVISTINFDLDENFQHMYNAYQAALVYGENDWRMLYILLIPVASALSYADSYFTEKESGVVNYVILRSKSKFKYFFSKYFVVLITSFLLTVFPFLLNQLLCLYFFTTDITTNGGSFSPYQVFFFDDHIYGIPYSYFFGQHPLLTNMMYIGLTGLYGSTIGLISYTITLFHQNKRASIIIFPIFIAFMLELTGSFTDRLFSPFRVTSVSSGHVVPFTVLLVVANVVIFFFVILRSSKKIDETEGEL
jgi:hypothetical protein